MTLGIHTRYCALILSRSRSVATPHLHLLVAYLGLIWQPIMQNINEIYLFYRV